MKLGRAISWRFRVSVMAPMRSRSTAARSKSRCRGGLLHLLLELFQETAALALEKEDRLLHRLAVVRGVHHPGAGPQAVLQLKFETRPGPGRQAALLAGAHPEDLLHHLEGLPRHGGGGEGAEIEGSVRVEAPHEPQGRELLLQVQAQTEIILVVPQHHVVAGTMLLDEVALQDQGLPAAGGDDEVHPGHLFQHQGGLGVVTVRGLEIRAQAVSQVDRLADVEYLAGGVFKQVDAAGLGHLAQGRGQGRVRRIRSLL